MVERRKVLGKRDFKTRQRGGGGCGRSLRRRRHAHGQRSVLGSHRDLRPVEDRRLERDLDFALAVHVAARDEYLPRNGLDDLVDRLDDRFRPGGFGRCRGDLRRDLHGLRRRRLGHRRSNDDMLRGGNGLLSLRPVNPPRLRASTRVNHLHLSLDRLRFFLDRIYKINRIIGNDGLLRYRLLRNHALHFTLDSRSFNYNGSLNSLRLGASARVNNLHHFLDRLVLDRIYKINRTIGNDGLLRYRFLHNHALHFTLNSKPFNYNSSLNSLRLGASARVNNLHHFLGRLVLDGIYRIDKILRNDGLRRDGVLHNHALHFTLDDRLLDNNRPVHSLRLSASARVNYLHHFLCRLRFFLDRINRIDRIIGNDGLDRYGLLHNHALHFTLDDRLLDNNRPVHSLRLSASARVNNLLLSLDRQFLFLDRIFRNDDLLRCGCFHNHARHFTLNDRPLYNNRPDNSLRLRASAQVNNLHPSLDRQLLFLDRIDKIDRIFQDNGLDRYRFLHNHTLHFTLNSRPLNYNRPVNSLRLTPARASASRTAFGWGIRVSARVNQLHHFLGIRLVLDRIDRII